MAKKRKFKFAYMHHLGTFPYEVLVAVGLSGEELERAARKFIKKKTDLEKVWDQFEDKENLSKYMACRGWCEWYPGGQSILWLREWGSKEFRSTLNHEVTHAVDYFYQHTSMDGMETRAYLQDYLYDGICDRLSEEYRNFKRRA